MKRISLTEFNHKVARAHVGETREQRLALMENARLIKADGNLNETYYGKNVKKAILKHVYVIDEKIEGLDTFASVYEKQDSIVRKKFKTIDAKAAQEMFHAWNTSSVSVKTSKMTNKFCNVFIKKNK